MSGLQSIALDRFGLGARPGDRAGNDPRSWVAEQLARYEPVPKALADQPGLAQSFAVLRDYREQAAERRRDRKTNPEMGRNAPENTRNMPRNGALASGKPVESDWPGLGTSALHEGRDLKPTMTLARVLAPALGRHYAVSPDRVAALFA